MIRVNKSELERILRAALGREFRTVDMVEGEKGTSITVEAFGRRYRLITHWAGPGWPSTVRTLAERVGTPWPKRAVVMARRLSPGAVDLLDEQGANYVDAAGRARIATPDGLVLIREPARIVDEAETAETRFAWSAGRADVAEILLIEGRVPSVREIAARSQLDIALVSRTLRAFDARGWTEKRGASRGLTSQRSLINGQELLDAWSEYVAGMRRESIPAHGVMKDPLRYLERELAPALSRLGAWAASGWGGLQLLAPYVTTVPTLHIYVEVPRFGEPLRTALSALGLREVTEGERVRFWPARPAALDSPRRGGPRRVPVVHPARLYADLMTLGDRGHAAAEHVRRELLRA